VFKIAEGFALQGLDLFPDFTLTFVHFSGRFCELLAVWGHSKSNPLANFAPSEFSDLVDHVHITTLAIDDDEPLLRSFVQHGRLPLRLK
jgi:hypothetical protein